VRTLTRPTLTEKQFAQMVVDLARILGWTCYRTWLSVRSPSGFPDLVLVRPPRLIFTELKSERGRLTEAQEVWLKLLRQVPGIEVHVWRPSDWESILAVLSRDGAAPRRG
jgi:type IV secretory pathway protease TraF